eukprot:jgi/Botrbrau1/2254/Bobra.101_2s0078.1
MTTYVLGSDRLSGKVYHLNPDGTIPDELRMKPGDLPDEVMVAATASGNVNSAAQNNSGNSTIGLKFAPGSESYRPTIEEVNKNAPTYQVPTTNGTVNARPMVSQFANQNSTRHAKSLTSRSPPPPSKKDGKVHSMQWFSQVVGTNWFDDTGPVQSNDSLSALGQFMELIVGVRIATPIFGSGFNFCISRYYDSFPKVGIIIPNPVAWLLPEFIQVGNTISTTLDLPKSGNGAPFGAKISPTSDGFLIWLPTVPVQTVSNFGFRWGLQVAQLFGVDVGVGWTSIRCGVDFIRV